MSIKQKVSKTLNVQAAESFVQEIQENAAYYIFAAKHTPFEADVSGGSDDAPPVPQDTVLSSLQIYNDMLFGKRVKTDNVTTLIKRNNWVENNVYAMYDDTDTDLADKPFYVVIDDVVEYNVYKCLYNNNGAKSTQKPFGKDTTPFEFPQDGYIWKYLFTIDQFDIRKFATDEYAPVTPTAAITAAAVPGSIEIVNIDTAGSGYNNYTTGSFPDSSSIAVGSNIRFGLDASASSSDQYYKNCLIKITSGVATGEYRLINDYTIESGRKIIEIESPFNSRPNAGDEYEIYPNVFIYDVSATSTVDCVARAIVNSSIGNAISRIEVLNIGRNYRIATAKIKVANIVPVTSNAVIRPIMSPPGGHGSNINNELFARYVGITTSFIGNNAPLTSNNDYRTVGLLKNPTYTNVNVKVDPNNVIGAFVVGENVYRYKPLKLFSNVSIAANSLVTGVNSTFVRSFRTNDRVIISNGITNLFANVQIISSDTQLTVDKTPIYVGGNNDIYLVQTELFGTVTSYDGVDLKLTSVRPIGWDISSYIVGDVTYCTAGVSNTQPAITINDRDAEEFSAYNQLNTLVGTFVSTTEFIEDEYLLQDTDDADTAPTARVHSFADNPGSANDYLYVTDVNNVFQVQNNGAGGTVRGETSDAYFTVRYKYNGEIVPDSGEILYLENLSPITRDIRQTETVKLILEF